MSKAIKKEVVAVQSVFEVEGALIEALPDAVVCFSHNRAIVFANHAAKNLFGKNLFGADLRDIFDENSTVEDAVKTVLKSGGTVALHDVAVNDRIALTVSCGPVTGTELFMLSLHMQPQQIKNERAEKARQALKPAQHMARMLAHEIKNPLAGIRGAAQLLESTLTGTDDRELIGLIVRETDRLSRLVEKVNIFEDAALESGVSLNIHETLGAVVQLSRTANDGIVIEEKYDPSLPDIQGHFDHLVQAFLNIVKNAAEAGADKIVIRTFYDTAAAYHPVHHAKLPLCIEIEDNGPGMDAATQAHVFEPYFSTKPQGEGLGLAIVSKIIDDHGGVIDLTSVPQKTVFRVCLPMVKS